MMEQQHHKTPYRSTPSPYLYDVDPSLHASQKPSEVPRVKRNLVQNLVDKFNEEAKRRELYRHHSVDDSLMRDVDHRPAGVTEANADNAPNHNHPFSYTKLSNNNNKNINYNKTSRNGLAGQRSRSDYNIGPIQQQQQQQQPSEIIYAHVKVNSGSHVKGSDKGKRIKTTVHTKVPNRMIASTSSVADSRSKSFAKSTGSLNMSAHEETVDDDQKIKHQKNGNYYRYAEVDENILNGGGGSRQDSSSRRGAVDGLDRRINRRKLDVDNLVTKAGSKDDPAGGYETRNVERWSENEVKPNSRKFTEHEYVHEVSVSSHDRPIPKEDYFASSTPRYIKDPRSSSSVVMSDEDEKKWRSLRRNYKDDSRRLTSSESGKQYAEVKRYYFGESEAPEKPPRQKWIKQEASPLSNRAGGGHHRLRRNSEESAASSGVGLLSSKLVKKANERFGNSGDDTFDNVHVPLYASTRRRRVSEGDSDVFPPAHRNWVSKRLEDNDEALVKYNNEQHHNGYTEESRKLIRREETHTKQRTQRTTRHHSPVHGNGGGVDEVDDSRGGRDRHVRSISPAVISKREVHHENGTKHNRHVDGGTTSKIERQVIQERSSSSSANRHRHHSNNKNGSFDAMEDRMETSESEQPLYGGSQESRMSLGSRLSSADEEQTSSNVDNVHTPHSVVRQMNKRQINYENSQQQQQHHHRETTNTGSGRRFWFERDDVMTNDRHDTDHRNNNRNNNNNNNNNNSNSNGGHRWTSATLSRLETNNKNHRNGAVADRRWASNTVDRNDVRRRNNKGNEIRIQVNDQDIELDARTFPGPVVDRSSSFNSRVGSYHSENESQGSGGSSSKSPGKTKRVNFKSKSANLSPVHREALLRSASPARAPSVAGSLKSNDSDVSHVILHATAVADIPPTRQYRLRSANTSPSPPASSIGIGNKKQESRTVNRSFSLLAPWKPRKYKEKYESSKLSATNGSAPNLHHDEDVEEKKHRTTTSTSGGSPQVRFKKISGDRAEASAGASRESSSEKLDSLSPLPSESAKASKKKSAQKKKSGLLRRHSMPKDSRFANFFRRKKDKEPKK